MDAPPSFEYAKEVVTQILTLATAVIGVSTTFATDLQKTIPKNVRKLLYSAWIVFLASIVCGLWVLASMAGTLATATSLKDDAIYDPNIAFPSIIQILLFFAGIFLLIWHAIKKSMS